MSLAVFAAPRNDDAEIPILDLAPYLAGQPGAREDWAYSCTGSDTAGMPSIGGGYGSAAMTIPQAIPFFSAAVNFAVGADTPRDFLERCLARLG